MNSITMTGRLAKTPELRQVGDHAVANFTVVHDVYEKGEYVGKFYPCTAWGKTAENIGKHFTKGKPITITGELSYRDSERDGDKRRFWDINVRSFGFVPRDTSEQAKTSSDTASNGDEDLPF